MINIYALTENINRALPGYISLNVVEDKTVLTVRSSGKNETSSMEIAEDELIRLRDSIDKHLTK